MSTMDWLGAGVFTYGRKLGDGLTWWLDELRAMARSTFPAPRRWARGWIAVREEDGAYRLSRPGRPDRRRLPQDRPVNAALMLPPGLALTRLLWRPPLPERDLRRMTELDLDRLTPFKPESVYAVIDIVGQADETGRRQIRVAVAPRVQVDELFARALQDGIRPKALVVSDGVGLIDFLPKMNERRSMAASRLTLAAWALVAELSALNLGVAIWRDVQTTDALQSRVAVEAPRMAHIAAARSELARLRTQAAAQAAARMKDDPLRVLAGLSRALPADASVQRLAWDGSTVRVVGEAQSGVDVAAALRRDPLFTDVHPSDGEGTPSGPQFDLTMTVAAAPGLSKR